MSDLSIHFDPKVHVWSRFSQKILAPNFMVPVFPLAYIYVGPQLFCIFRCIVPTFPIFWVLGCNYGISAVLLSHSSCRPSMHVYIKFRLANFKSLHTCLLKKQITLLISTELLTTLESGQKFYKQKHLVDVIQVSQEGLVQLFCQQAYADCFTECGVETRQQLDELVVSLSHDSQVHSYTLWKILYGCITLCGQQHNLCSERLVSLLDWLLPKAD